MQYLNLDYEMIKKEYPKTVKLIEKWYKELPNMNWGLLDPKYDVDDLAEKLVATIIQHDPRKLYDFFDSKECRIFVTDYIGPLSTGETPMFYSYNSIAKTSTGGSSRIEVEKIAFIQAFSILEAVSSI